MSVWDVPQFWIFWGLGLLTLALYLLKYRNRWLLVFSGFLFFVPFFDPIVLAHIMKREVVPKNRKETFSVCVNNTDDRAYRSLRYWKTLEEMGCDVVLLQEVWPLAKGLLFVKGTATNTEFLSASKEVYPYIASAAEFVVVSRYPLVEVYKARYEGFFVVDVVLEDTKIRFLNLHLWNPLFAAQSSGGRSYNPTKLRALQQEELLEYLLKQPKNLKIVIAGDFNTQPFNRLLLWDLPRLGYIKAGTLLLQPTFSSILPGITIDHLFYKNLLVTSYNIYFLPHSDHAVMKVDISL